MHGPQMKFHHPSSAFLLKTAHTTLIDTLYQMETFSSLNFTKLATETFFCLKIKITACTLFEEQMIRKVTIST